MSETTDKIVDKIVGDATSRLKIPIVSTYLCILIINNWDILYFIMFSKVDATSKILYVKTHYDFWDYVIRVGGSLLYAIAILVLFTFLDYFLVKWLKDISIKKKTVQQQIVDHNTLEDLKKVNSDFINKNKNLQSDFIRLETDNQSLKSRVSQLSSEINLSKSNIEFSELIKKINSDIPNSYVNYELLIRIIKSLSNTNEYGKSYINYFSFVSKINSNDRYFSKLKHIFSSLNELGYIELIEKSFDDSKEEGLPMNYEEEDPITYFTINKEKIQDLINILNINSMMNY